MNGKLLGLDGLLRDRSGAAAAEYALLLVGVFVAIVGAVALLGTSISGVFSSFTPSL